MVRFLKMLQCVLGKSIFPHIFYLNSFSNTLVVLDNQGPLRFIKVKDYRGLERGLGHIHMIWDDELEIQIGNGICGNGDGSDCLRLGSVRHAGHKFSDTPSETTNFLTARGELAGPVGGYGWIIDFDDAVPREINFVDIEVLPDTPMLVRIPYPTGTTFKITANAAWWCWQNSAFSCSEEFVQVSTVEEVRNGPGNQYCVDNGAVVFRIVMTPVDHIGRPNWYIPSVTDPDRSGYYAIDRIERDGVFLPIFWYGVSYNLVATCGGSGTYCSGSPVSYDPDVCPAGYEQVAYDYCCSTSNGSQCIGASGSSI